MYIELTAPTQLAFKRAYWEADLVGLDPQLISPLTFSIGTGNIEKVSRIRDKHDLLITHESDYEPIGYRW